MIHRVRAIIIEDNKLLTIKRVKKDLVYYVFPGGGVEKDEDFESAMKRECKEELGVNIEIVNNFTSERFDINNIEQLEHFYVCKIFSGELGTGDGPEYDENSEYEGTHEIKWINVKDLLNYDLRPSNIVLKLIDYIKK